MCAIASWVFLPDRERYRFSTLGTHMKIHFIGIGGTAMGSVAIAAQEAGYTVTGSDTALYPPMSDVLRRAGVVMTEGFSENTILNASPDLVVVGNAISRGNPELEYVLDHRMPMTSMAAFVGEHFICRHTSIVVTGTHGKTTTTSITAWLAESVGRSPGFLIGGVPGNFSVGCRPVPDPCTNRDDGLFISEGDEYDTAFFDKRSKFVHYRPTVLILNNIEFDHADIFSDLQAILTSFRHVVRLVPRNGSIIANADDGNIGRVLSEAHCRIISVGMAVDADVRITDDTTTETSSTWSLTWKDGTSIRYSIPMGGLHNVRNASMAILAILQAIGDNQETRQKLARGLVDFAPPKRRLERIGSWKGATVIDDFAHHPTAIATTVRTLKSDGHQLHCVFEPRSNTTTRAFFQRELAECFDGAASVCIGPVNRPERYAPEDRLDTDLLVRELQAKGIHATSIPSDRVSSAWGRDVAEWLTHYVREGDTIVILSNGAVGGTREVLTQQT